MNSELNLGFGTVALTTLKSKKEVFALLDAVYSNGIRYFDTAPIYGSGYSEIILGDYLKKKRHQVEIATKFGLSPTREPNIPYPTALRLNYWKKRVRGVSKPSPTNLADQKKIPHREITKSQVAASLKNSLARLKTDYIDVYLLHEALPNFLTEEAFHFLLSSKEKRIIRKLGVAASSLNTYSMEETKLDGWDILQYDYGSTPLSSKILKKWPSMIHHHHSVFGSLNMLGERERKNQKVKELLADFIANNANGKLLFSSTRKENIAFNANTYIDLCNGHFRN